jgi:ribosomal protein S18 acetylase RimI-like enzyme
MNPAFVVAQVLSPQDLACVRELFQQYAESVKNEYPLPDFEMEMAGLPGEYGPPAGRLFMAQCGRLVVGCAALRKTGEGVCEMRRLYVRSGFRGQGVGHLLADAVLGAAREIGYERMRLDTVASMEDAVSLYHSLGFRDVSVASGQPGQTLEKTLRSSTRRLSQGM